MARSQDDAKRTGILASAFRAFGEHGFSSATMKQIARDSGIAPGSIYTYFRDKKDLFRVAAGEGWKMLLTELTQTLREDLPLEERLDQLLEISFRRLRQSLPLLRGMLFEASRLREFHDNLDRFCDVVVRLLDQGRREGRLRIETQGWKRLVRVMLNGVLFTAAIAPDRETDEELDAMKTALRAFLRARLREGAST